MRDNGAVLLSAVPQLSEPTYSLANAVYNNGQDDNSQPCYHTVTYLHVQ